MSPAPKPFFSLWVQKRIPFVERAGDNPVYCAFRERRNRRGWLGLGLLSATGRRAPSPVGCVVLLGFGFFLLIPVALLSPFGSPRQMLLLAGLGVAALVAAAIWTHNTVGRRIPLRANVAFNPQAPNAAVALDLWQCGVTGRQIAEAVILENLESIVLANVIVQILGGSVFLLVLLAPAPLAYEVAYTAAIILMGLAHFFLSMGAFPYGPQKNILVAINARWRRSEDLWTRVRRDLPRKLKEFVVTVVSIVLLLMSISLAVRVVVGIVTGASEALPTWAVLQIIGLGAYALLFLLSLLIVTIFRPREVLRLERYLTQADAAFDVYIRNELLQDPDAFATPQAEIKAPASPD